MKYISNHLIKIYIWCVTNITTEPSSFNKNSALTESNKPVWETCLD